MNLDETSRLTPEQWAYLEQRVRGTTVRVHIGSQWPPRSPMALSSFCALQLARVKDRLVVLEDRLKRNDLQAAARNGQLQRYLANWNRLERKWVH